MPRKTSKGPKTSLTKKICIVHMGAEKTGSTALQDWLELNKATLQSNGIALTGLHKAPANWAFVNYFQKNLDEWSVNLGISTQEEKQTFFSGFADTFDEGLNALQSPVVVISSEHFSSRLKTIDELRLLKKFLKFRFRETFIVGWFRPQWHVASSSWSTHLKSGGFVDLKTHLEQVHPRNYYFNYHLVASSWAQVFGKENCFFNQYKSDSDQSFDVRRDFTRVMNLIYPLGVGHGMKFPIARENASLSLVQATLLKVMNSPEMAHTPSLSIKMRSDLKQRVMSEFVDFEEDYSLRLSLDSQTRIYRAFQDSNRRLAEEFLAGESFPAPLCENPEYVSTEQMADLLDRVTKRLLKAILNP